MPNSKYYCATFYKEPTLPSDDNLRYMINGQETCPTTKKIHWQSYLEFKKPVSMKDIKNMFNDNTIHLEKRAGTREQARDYCKKDGNFKEYGIWSTGKGFRTDLKEFTNKLADGTIRLSELMLEEPTLYCKYRNGLKDIQAAIDKKKNSGFRHVEVEVISGPTGLGKTRLAMEHAKFKIEGSKIDWFDGYDNEDTILIDEYDNDIKITSLLNLLDGYQLRLPIKGSFCYAGWTKVYITTNLRKEQLHEHAKPAHRDALFRRITKWTDLWP